MIDQERTTPYNIIISRWQAMQLKKKSIWELIINDWSNTKFSIYQTNIMRISPY